MLVNGSFSFTFCLSLFRSLSSATSLPFLLEIVCGKNQHQTFSIRKQNATSIMRLWLQIIRKTVLKYTWGWDDNRMKCFFQLLLVLFWILMHFIWTMLLVFPYLRSFAHLSSRLYTRPFSRLFASSFLFLTPLIPFSIVSSNVNALHPQDNVNV